MPRPSKYAYLLFLFILPILSAVPVKAQTNDTDTQASSASQSTQDPWAFKNRFGHYGFEMGFSKEIKLNNAQTSNVGLLTFRPQYTIRLGDLPKNRVFYRFELVTEPTAIIAFRPHLAGIYGLNEIVRLDFPPVGREKRLIFYVDAGAGVNQFNLKVPQELTGKFQFSLQFGPGFKYRLKNSRWAVGCALKGTHFSDNGIHKPNQGINLPDLSCGMDYLPKN